MSEPTPDLGVNLWWYEYHVLPVLGFVRAEDADQAKAAALDDATDRLRSYLADSPVKLERIEPCQSS